MKDEIVVIEGKTICGENQKVELTPLTDEQKGNLKVGQEVLVKMKIANDSAFFSYMCPNINDIVYIFPPEELPKLNKGVNLMREFDARVWAKEFTKAVRECSTIATDEDTMIAWFANAIMAGYDKEKKQIEDKEKAETTKLMEKFTDLQDKLRELIK